ncbi:MAG: fatty acid desaturase [Verrucomicrobia bacterium]|nr:fatty acid desaturase [Verrucomicrobiota bacterium]MDE3047409.1 fatty acid desaturase [Verrucomicrobiota bacterium]
MRDNMKKIAWAPFLYIIGYHLFLAIALPIYFMSHTPSWGLVATTLSLVFISGLAVTAGYHRCYSHSCYKMHPAVDAVLLFFATLATQGSALRWTHDHRLHHAHVDTDKDPYSVKKGLLYAHILWMFKKSVPIDSKVISDLSRRSMLIFQHKYYPVLMVVANVMTFLTVGWLFNDYLGAFLFAWWVRTLLLHHTTWCINSLAHFWGTRDYSQEHSAVDNYLISLLTYGEGYHNYHHTFAYDYRNGIRWYHFDPTKWLIWTLYKLGLASDLKTVNNYRIARHLLLQHKDELVQKLKESAAVQKVQEVADRLSTTLAQLQSMLDPVQIRAAKKSLREDWREWRHILKTLRKESLLNA